jgi:hypothetical protein
MNRKTYLLVFDVVFLVSWLYNSLAWLPMFALSFMMPLSFAVKVTFRLRQLVSPLLLIIFSLLMIIKFFKWDKGKILLLCLALNFVAVAILPDNLMAYSREITQENLVVMAVACLFGVPVLWSATTEYLELSDKK